MIFPSLTSHSPAAFAGAPEPAWRKAGHNNQSSSNNNERLACEERGVVKGTDDVVAAVDAALMGDNVDRPPLPALICFHVARVQVHVVVALADDAMAAADLVLIRLACFRIQVRDAAPLIALVLEDLSAYIAVDPDANVQLGPELDSAEQHVHKLAHLLYALNILVHCLSGDGII